MSGHASKIYVQIDIQSPVDRVWCLTQTPDLHQQWDLRFSEIRYLPRPDTSQPQRFLYATRIGFGLYIRGEGESVGQCDGPAGESSSALRFWSQDPKSLILDGSGYWKYVPHGENGQTTRFLTLYDYQVRFNACGRLLDRMVFRPLIGWATAWSFDRLRLWIEKDISPAASMRYSLCYLASRLTLAFIWIYEGLVPKLLLRHPQELAMLRALGLGESAARGFCIGIGCVEVAIGLLLVAVWRSRGLLWLTLVAMPLALVGVALRSPSFLLAPFNPTTLNLAVFALAAIALLIVADVPSASHCVRQPKRGDA